MPIGLPRLPGLFGSAYMKVTGTLPYVAMKTYPVDRKPERNLLAITSTRVGMIQRDYQVCKRQRSPAVCGVIKLCVVGCYRPQRDRFCHAIPLDG